MRKFVGMLWIVFGLVACDTVEVPPTAQAVGTLALDVTTLAHNGETLFGQNCSKCHAFQGNAAPDLVGAGARLDQKQFDTVVTYGRAGMPAHPRLTTVEKQALWTFISTATNDSDAIAKTREGEGCGCGGACGGHGAGAAAKDGAGCGGGCGGHGAGAAAKDGEGCGGGCGGHGNGEGCGGGCGHQ
ncbi:MAG: cytochrome c [bacterium]